MLWRATCPTFDEGMQLMFDGDNEMIDYVLRLVAFSLYGNADAKMLPLCYGADGNNGKTTFLLLLRMLCGEYYGDIPMEALVERKRQPRAPDENLANLQGKRLVTTSETSHYQLNGSLIKRLTDGTETEGV